MSTTSGRLEPKGRLDVIVIGGGSAGLAALREVKKETDRFVLINDGHYGTTCARVGCMPSKTLIEAANAFHARRKADTFGIRGGETLTVDISAVLERVRALRDRFVAGALPATDSLGERNIPGRARFAGPNTVVVDGRVLEADRIIIAAGSRPIVPETWRNLGGRLLTTDTLFEQESLPRRMAVIGLGAVGVEMAQALSRLGIEITAIGKNDMLAGLTDPTVNDSLLDSLRRELTVYTGVDPEPSVDDGTERTGGAIHIRIDAASSDVAEVDAILVAIGRTPNLEELGIETLGIPLDANGMPPFDPNTTQIAGLPVFIAGDINGYAPILHEAADEGFIAGHNATTAETECFRRRTPMGIVFSDPGTAFVGARFAQLDPDRTAVGSADFAHQGRAITAQRDHGIIRVYASRDDARIVGAEMCAPAAEHLAHLLALAIHQNLTVHDMLGMPFYHPVLEEGLRTALRDLSRQYDTRQPDLATCDPYHAEALD